MSALVTQPSPLGPFYRSGALTHQLVAFERFKDDPHFALFFFPRCRKTGTTLAIFRHRWERGDVDALVVLSNPSGVKWVWAEEVPKEFPPEMLKRTRVLVWESGKTGESNASKERIFALRAHDGPVVLSMNAQAIWRSDKGWKYLEWFIARRRVMMVADESSWAARWSGQTKRLLTLGGRRGRDTSNIVVRAILDGTPVEESPTDIYYPSEFLRPGLLGYATKAAFQARYCEYGTEQLNHRTNTFYRELKGYCNLDELRAKMMTFGMRVRFEDITDAPPKTYVSQYFEMSDWQRRVYDELLCEYTADLGTRRVTAPEVLYRMTRLQMVARNYWPPERRGVACVACDGFGFAAEGGDCPACEGLGTIVETTALERIDPECNPAIDALLDAVGAVRQPFVVWCRFRQDASDAVDALRDAGYLVVEHHGGVPDAVAEANYQAFKNGGDGAPIGIVATVAGGLSFGKDLSRATLAVFYSNDFKARLRRQAEDRTEGVLRRTSTTVVDLIAVGTRDVDVVEALRAKRELAAEVMGDPRPGFG